MTENMDQVIVLDLGYVPEAAISGAVLVQTESSCFLTFNAMRVEAGRNQSRAGFALVEFPGCLCTRFGYPNDEAFPGHPLFAKVQALYPPWTGIYQVLNSSWIRQVEQQNRKIFPNSSLWSVRHFIFGFHDSTFECIADDLVSQVIDEPFSAVLARISKRVLAE